MNVTLSKVDALMSGMSGDHECMHLSLVTISAMFGWMRYSGCNRGCNVSMSATFRFMNVKVSNSVAAMSGMSGGHP